MNMAKMLASLPGQPGVEDLISFLAGTAAFLIVAAVWLGLRPANPLARRMKSIHHRRETLRTSLMAPRRRAPRAEAMSAMRSVINRLRLLRSKHAEEIQHRLTLAGWRSKDALVVYLFFKIFLPFVFGAVGLVVLYIVELYDVKPMMRLAIALGVVVAGAYLPEFVVRNQVSKRRKKIIRGLPDALDLMVICTEAGLGLEAALHRVSGEIAPNAPELADELQLTAIELGFLPDRKVALANLTARTDLPSIRGVVNTLVQTEKYGTPLASSLRVLAAEFRDERMLKAEEKAAKLPATLTVPMIIFILPTLFIVLVGPAILKAIDTLSHVSL